MPTAFVPNRPPRAGEPSFPPAAWRGAEPDKARSPQLTPTSLQRTRIRSLDLIPIHFCSIVLG